MFGVVVNERRIAGDGLMDWAFEFANSHVSPRDHIGIMSNSEFIYLFILVSF